MNNAERSSPELTQPESRLTLSAGQFLAILQLTSPGLPVGAYSYSEGIEALVDAQQLRTADEFYDWLSQELRWGMIRLEAGIVLAAHQATLAQDWVTLSELNQRLSALRETEEMRSQNWQMGRSLLKLLQELRSDWPAELQPLLQIWLGLEPSRDGDGKPGINYGVVFGLAAALWQLDAPATILSYLQAWVANLISAGVRLVPLGQTQGQRVLLNLAAPLQDTVEQILAVNHQSPDWDALVGCGWGLSLASMSHETQYSRLFRS
ncbi:MAG: urease accessory protein UreF [Cyanobacteria bacterium P01_H01_bin.121]